MGDYAFSQCFNLTAIYARGNPPAGDASLVFFGIPNWTIYYLPSTSGWGPPAVLWNPTILTTNTSFGIKTNRFGFTLTGTADIPIVVEATTNVAGGPWTSLLNGTLTNGSIYFSDSQWTNYPRRSYRIRSP